MSMARYWTGWACEGCGTPVRHYYELTPPAQLLQVVWDGLRQWWCNDCVAYIATGEDLRDA